MTHEISIIIPTKDKWPRLRLTLKSLEIAYKEYPFETILVDDGSSDETKEELKNTVFGLDIQIVTFYRAKGAAAHVMLARA